MRTSVRILHSNILNENLHILIFSTVRHLDIGCTVIALSSWTVLFQLVHSKPHTIIASMPGSKGISLPPEGPIPATGTRGTKEGTR